MHRVPYGARLKVDEGDKVKRGQRIAEWDPYTRPMLTEVDGIVAFEDLVEGVSVRGNGRRIDRHHQARRHRLARRAARQRPAARRSSIQDGKGKVGKLPRGGEARYLLSVEAISRSSRARKVRAGDVLARIPMESAKTRDITGGLPRVAELFEARRPKDARHHRRDRRHDPLRPRLQEQAPHHHRAARWTLEPVEYLIPKGKPFHLQDGDVIEKGDYIVDGNPAPHDILAIKGVEALAAYLVNEIQEVYRLQGVSINDKHIEVIVRQMLQKVEITDPGDIDLHPGRAGRRDRTGRGQRAAGRGGQEAGRRPAGAARHHQGIAADAVLHLGRLLPGDDPRPDRGGGRRQDRHARGLKENVIVGRLIPAGTGAMVDRLREIATRRDELILRRRRRRRCGTRRAKPPPPMTGPAGCRVEGAAASPCPAWQRPAAGRPLFCREARRARASHSPQAYPCTSASIEGVRLPRAGFDADDSGRRSLCQGLSPNKCVGVDAPTPTAKTRELSGRRSASRRASRRVPKRPRRCRRSTEVARWS